MSGSLRSGWSSWCVPLLSILLLGCWWIRSISFKCRIALQWSCPVQIWKCKVWTQDNAIQLDRKELDQDAVWRLITCWQGLNHIHNEACGQSHRELFRVYTRCDPDRRTSAILLLLLMGVSRWGSHPWQLQMIRILDIVWNGKWRSTVCLEREWSVARSRHSNMARNYRWPWRGTVQMK